MKIYWTKIDLETSRMKKEDNALQDIKCFTKSPAYSHNYPSGNRLYLLFYSFKYNCPVVALDLDSRSPSKETRKCERNRPLSDHLVFESPEHVALDVDLGISSIIKPLSILKHVPFHGKCRSTCLRVQFENILILYLLHFTAFTRLVCRLCWHEPV